MALTTYSKNAILNSIKGNFTKVRLIYDNLSSPTALGSAVSSHTLYGAEVGLVWATASNGSSVATTNSYNSTPIMFAVQQNGTPNRVILHNASNVSLAKIDLPATLPTYTTGDGAYYVRGITLTLIEV